MRSCSCAVRAVLAWQACVSIKQQREQKWAGGGGEHKGATGLLLSSHCTAHLRGLKVKQERGHQKGGGVSTSGC
jgi:hypothetical protein